MFAVVAIFLECFKQASKILVHFNLLKKSVAGHLQTPSLPGKVVIYSQDLGYSIPGLRILNPDNLVLGFIFKDPES